MINRVSAFIISNCTPVRLFVKCVALITHRCVYLKQKIKSASVKVELYSVKFIFSWTLDRINYQFIGEAGTFVIRATISAGTDIRCFEASHSPRRMTSGAAEPPASDSGAALLVHLVASAVACTSHQAVYFTLGLTFLAVHLAHHVFLAATLVALALLRCRPPR